MTEACVRSIPTALREADRWLVWRARPKANERIDKIPCRVDTGAECDAHDAANWATLDDALAFLGPRLRTFAGLGFDLGDGYAGVDLDDCRDPQTGEVHPAAVEVIRRLDSYCEVSPSGRGVKVFLRADLGDQEGNRKSSMAWGGGIELYWQGRFFTITGQHLNGTPETVEDRQGQLTALHLAVLGEAATTAQSARPEPVALDLPDSDLLAVAFRAANGDTIRALFDEAGAEGNSERDAALCGHLAFYSGGDAARLERMAGCASRRP